MLEVGGLEVRYGGITAVREVSLQVEEGEVVALLGPNGAGKSSTLGAIMGLVRPTCGQIRFRGADISRLQTEQIVRKGIALTPEGRRILTQLTVRENLTLAAAGRRRRGDVQADLETILDRFPIVRERLDSPAGTLSGGQAQQLAIARSLMSAPQLLLLDEPTLGLAPLIVDLIFDTIAELRNNGLTVLVVEQNAMRALEIADRAYVMRTGSIVAAGTSDELGGGAGLASAYLGKSASA